MPAVFRKLMILTFAFLLLICPALSESAGTQPGYPFPTEVEGYTFVSFADNQQLFMEANLYDISEDLHDIILPVPRNTLKQSIPAAACFSWKIL